MNKVYRILSIEKTLREVPDGYYTTTERIHVLKEVGYCNDYDTLEEAENDLNSINFDGEFTIIPIYTQ